MPRLPVIGWILLFLGFCLMGYAHEGHHHALAEGTMSSDQFKKILKWIGRFHLLILHFPIALIVMTVVAEWLWIWFANPIFAHAARFMILAAAIFVVPTALLGFAFGYGQSYEELELSLYTWHRNFGIITTFLAILTAILRECYVRQQISTLTSYYICLFFLFVCLNLTGTLGGGLAFGLTFW